MALPPPSNEVRTKILTLSGLNDRDMKQSVQQISDWYILQPHLPQYQDDAFLERLLIRCKGSVERAKEALDMYYTVRTAIPEIFSERDPSQPWFKLASSVRCILPLPRLTSELERVTLVSCLDSNPDHYHVYDILKLMFMVCEIRMREDYHLSDVILVDLDNITVAHVIKYTLPVLRRLEISAVKGFKARVKGVHFLNVPPFVDTTIQLFKSLMKPKLAGRIRIHRKDSKSILDFIPSDILPKEYGGDAPSIHKQWVLWKEKLESYRTWFVEQDGLKVDESKRPGKIFNSSELFGFEGTFRQLNID